MKQFKSMHAAGNRKPLKRSVNTIARPASETPVLDRTDLLLLEELQQNARTSFTELARRIHLSTPAVIDRIRRLEDTGILLGYRAHINPAALGLGIRAFVKVTVAGDRILPISAEGQSVTGERVSTGGAWQGSFKAQIAVRDMDHLEQVLDSLMPYVSTNTSIVLNSPVSHAGIATHTGIAPDTDKPRRRKS